MYISNRDVSKDSVHVFQKPQLWTTAKRRISVKQSHRPNVPTESVEHHYRVNVLCLFIDHITSELDAMFSQRNEAALLPAYLVPRGWYREDLPDPDTECWRYEFHSEDESLPTTALETLQATQMAFFPNIKCVLQI